MDIKEPFNRFSIDKVNKRSILNYYWLFIIVSLVLVFFLFYKSNAYNIGELKKINQGLMHTIMLDTHVDNLAIKNLVGVEADYDKLAKAVDELEVFSQQYFKQLDDRSQQFMHKYWQEFENVLREKLEDIEVFKSSLSILRNSSTYLPLLLDSFKKSDPKQTSAISLVNELELQMFLFHANDTIVNENSIKQTLMAFNALFPSTNEPSLNDPSFNDRSAEHLLIDRHISIILEEKALLNELTRKILNGKVQNKLNQVNKTYIRYHEELIYHANIYRNSFLIIIIILSIVVFLTLRKQISTSNQLKRSLIDLNFRKLAEDEHCIVSITDVSGKITFVNDKFLEVSKFSRKELLGAKHNIIKSGYHDDSYFKSMWRTIAQGKTWNGVVKNKAKDGSYYWVESTIVPFLDENNKPFQYISLRTDITEQMLIREKLAENNAFMSGLTNALGEGVLAIDLNQKCTFFNDMAEDLLGWQKNEVLGRELSTFLTMFDEHRLKINADYSLPKLCLTYGVAKTSEDCFLEHKGKTIYPVYIKVTPFYVDDELSGAVIVFSDITQRKKLLSELSEAKERAEEANQMKSDFIANMSHELRTPLNAIIGLNHLVMQTKLDSQQSDYLNKVESSSQILLGLINDVLDMSKIEAGKLILESIPYNLDQHLNNLKLVMIDKANEKKIDLNFSIDTNIPKILIGDSLRLNQVLMNLISNAIKFTKNGSVSLNLSIKQLLQETKQLQLLYEVVDTGMGITEEQQKSLFLAFTQADTSTSRKHGGTGLGLNISKNLVHMMGGTLAVKSQIGVGSTFYFDLPLAYQEEVEQVSDKNQQIKHEMVSVKEGNTKVTDKPLRFSANILLAEDNKINQLVASKMLAKYGLEVTIANDGQEAIDLAQDIHFDLVLMDIQMPQVDGIEATMILREKYLAEDLAIVAVTAHALDEEKQRCLDSGMNDHLSKPIIPLELERILQKFLKSE